VPTIPRILDAIGATLIMHPWVALLVAGAVALLCVWRRSWPAAVAAIGWAGYAGYEYLMFVRILCSGDCNIRVDLLFVYPGLLMLTVLALVSAYRKG
jgi:hypothetical protein